MTVRENFMFSANVRLPSTVTKAEKEKRVDEVINALGLTHCADTKVIICAGTMIDVIIILL